MKSYDKKNKNDRSEKAPREGQDLHKAGKLCCVNEREQKSKEARLCHCGKKIFPYPNK